MFVRQTVYLHDCISKFLEFIRGLYKRLTIIITSKRLIILKRSTLNIASKDLWNHAIFAICFQ